MSWPKRSWRVLLAGMCVAAFLPAATAEPLNPGKEGNSPLPMTRQKQLIAAYEAMPPEGIDANRHLGPLMAKLAAGKPVTLVFFGGSITWGGNVTGDDVDELSYRALVTKRLRQQFPKSKITSVNAALGGTGSQLGAFRADRHAFSHDPDLLVIEFTVNDGGKARGNESMEAILRRAIQRYPKAQPLVVIAVSLKGPDYQPNLQLAQHYDVPVVNLSKFVHERMDANDFQWTDFSHDVCHPNDFGHGVYAARILALLNASRDKGERKALPMPEPMTPNRYATATLVPPKDLHVLSGWKLMQPAYGPWSGTIPANPPADDKYWPHPFRDGFLSADEPNAAFEYTFRGDMVGLHGDWQEGCGRLRVEIDGKVRGRFEMNGVRWAKDRIPIDHRVWDRLGEGEHTIRVTLDSLPRDKDGQLLPRPKLGRARVGYLLIAPPAER